MSVPTVQKDSIWLRADARFPNAQETRSSWKENASVWRMRLKERIMPASIASVSMSNVRSVRARHVNNVSKVSSWTTKEHARSVEKGARNARVPHPAQNVCQDS